MLTDEAKKNLTEGILPFWMNLMDREHGGFYGEVDFDMNVAKQSDKGTILVSRIMWLFSRAYIALKDEAYLDTARHAYEYFHTYCYDKEYGGIYWSTHYDGTPADTVKHTYTMSYGIYGLTAYYEACGDASVLKEAMDMYSFIEERCRDESGYMEEFDREFHLKDNEKVSDALAPRGYFAPKTMNTLLHLLEAYTELYRVSRDIRVEADVMALLRIFTDKVYNPSKRRLEVFFDNDYNSLIDTQSYGHDIESAWLIDYAVDVIKKCSEDDSHAHMDIDGKLAVNLFENVRAMTDDLRASVYERAVKGDRVISDIMEGVVNETKVWWVHAETVNGYLLGYRRQPDHPEYMEAAQRVLEYITKNFVDSRSGEWFNELDEHDAPVRKELAGPWKCPYHNGRMWLNILQ